MKGDYCAICCANTATEGKTFNDCKPGRMLTHVANVPVCFDHVAEAVDKALNSVPRLEDLGAELMRLVREYDESDGTLPDLYPDDFDRLEKAAVALGAKPLPAPRTGEVATVATREGLL